ncbi:MAG TPA: pilus assembly PilX N-terminal domain-containing protein [Pyrinomonadaceae bacterium]
MLTIVSQDNGNGRGERGAALITTLLISALLLTAGAMLILTTSMSATNTVDAAAEMQAYYGAEAGLQATLNVMRGNVLPNPLFVANPVGGVAPENRIDFTKALKAATSNLAGDPTTAGFPVRLSRWLSYNYRPTGSTYDNRVGISPGYNPFNGVAYDIQLIDPDGTDLLVAKPVRMIVKSTGYGPRGARKTLSMMLHANGLDIEVPAALVLRGHDDVTTDLTIDLGSSAAKTYSGADNAGLVTPAKPALAVCGHDVDTVQAAYAGKPGSLSNPKLEALALPTDPPPSGIQTAPTPWFLKTADNARAFLVQAETLANSCSAPGSPCPKRGVVLSSLSGYAGTAAAPQFTIVKGDCNLDGGAGLLIVTGTLYFNGPGPNFNGIILVLGQGRLLKQGGGNRDILGSIMIARFGATGGFLAPTFDYGDGAGTSNLQYDSRNVSDATIMPGAIVLGIAEKAPL